MAGQQTGRGPAPRACPELPNLETAESAGLLSVKLSSWPAQYTVEPPIMDTQNQENLPMVINTPKKGHNLCISIRYSGVGPLFFPVTHSTCMVCV